MREGARGGGDTSALGRTRLTPLRYLALAIALVGVALALLADGATGAYALALAFMVAALEERLYGRAADGTAYLLFGFLLLGLAGDWALLIGLSAAGIVVTALAWTYREFGPTRYPAD